MAKLFCIMISKLIQKKSDFPAGPNLSGSSGNHFLAKIVKLVWKLCAKIRQSLPNHSGAQDDIQHDTKDDIQNMVRRSGPTSGLV